MRMLLRRLVAPLLLPLLSITHVWAQDDFLDCLPPDCQTPPLNAAATCLEPSCAAGPLGGVALAPVVEPPPPMQTKASKGDFFIAFGGSWDIANAMPALKHLKLDKPPHPHHQPLLSGARPLLSPKQAPLPLPPPPQIERIKLYDIQPIQVVDPPPVKVVEVVDQDVCVEEDVCAGTPQQPPPEPVSHVPITSFHVPSSAMVPPILSRETIPFGVDSSRGSIVPRAMRKQRRRARLVQLLQQQQL